MQSDNDPPNARRVYTIVLPEAAVPGAPDRVTSHTNSRPIFGIGIELNLYIDTDEPSIRQKDEPVLIDLRQPNPNVATGSNVRRTLNNRVDVASQTVGTLDDRADMATQTVGTLDDRADMATQTVGTLDNRVDVASQTVGSESVSHLPANSVQSSTSASLQPQQNDLALASSCSVNQNRTVPAFSPVFRTPSAVDDPMSVLPGASSVNPQFGTPSALDNPITLFPMTSSDFPEQFRTPVQSARQSSVSSEEEQLTLAPKLPSFQLPGESSAFSQNQEVERCLTSGPQKPQQSEKARTSIPTMALLLGAPSAGPHSVKFTPDLNRHGFLKYSGRNAFTVHGLFGPAFSLRMTNNLSTERLLPSDVSAHSSRGRERKDRPPEHSPLLLHADARSRPVSRPSTPLAVARSRPASRLSSPLAVARMEPAPGTTPIRINSPRTQSSGPSAPVTHQRRDQFTEEPDWNIKIQVSLQQIRAMVDNLKKENPERVFCIIYKTPHKVEGHRLITTEDFSIVAFEKAKQEAEQQVNNQQLNAPIVNEVAAIISKHVQRDVKTNQDRMLKEIHAKMAAAFPSHVPLVLVGNPKVRAHFTDCPQGAASFKVNGSELVDEAIIALF